MPDIILLSGVSGTGKTYLRKNSYLSQYPCVDIADIYTELPTADWVEATTALITRVKKLLREHETVVVEGYFLPGTASRHMLSHGFWGYSGQEIFLHTQYDVCVQRIRDSGVNVETRLELLEARWNYADKIHKGREQ